LKTRCKAIQRALAVYNAAAKTIDRPPLDWSAISQYGSLAEFELLRESRTDIRALPWADSANRQVAIYQLKLERAHEERIRLNIEIQWLLTSMRDEEGELSQHAEALNTLSPWLAAELKTMLARRVRLNDVHRARMQQIFILSSYNGAQVPGIRAGQTMRDVGISDLQMHNEGLDDSDTGEQDIYSPDEDDFIGDQLDSLVTYLENLTLTHE